MATDLLLLPMWMGSQNLMIEINISCDFFGIFGI